MDIKKIVITGGPCGGKSTAMGLIKNEFEKLGYTVLFVPETATELINGGVAPWTTGTVLDCQIGIMKLQLAKESVFLEAGKTMPCEKLLIVCDRGAMDNKAYIDDEGFQRVLQSVNETEVNLRDSYDAVFHLVTTAKGAVEFYTTENNTARIETVEQAAALDDKLISVWTGHPHLRIIDNSTDFENKMKRLIKEISSFLGEPEPLEIERKYLIEYPDLKHLEALPNCERVEIIQTYLKHPDGTKSRIRQRGRNGDYIFFETAKKEITPVKRIEIERRISEKEYLSLMKNADPSRKPIIKDRYCYAYDNQYFEIDVYPFWKDKAIMEIELCDEATEIRFPPDIKIIRDVTAENEYKNSSLAKIK